jgi:MFS family permease
MPERKNALFVIAIMLSCVVIMGELIVTPIFYNIFAAFPDNALAANTIVSGPALMVVIASLLATVLMKRLSKKSIILFGTILFTLCGIAGGIFSSVYLILVSRLFNGLGVGLVNVAAFALIAEVYTDENKRATFMGVFNGVMAGIGAVLSILSGLLAVTLWRESFKLYYLGIPVLVMTAFFLPGGTHESAAEDVSARNTVRRQPLGKTFWTMLGAFAFFSLAYGIIMFFTSTYVAENSLGTEVFAGTLTSLATVGSMVFCLAFGIVYRKFKQSTVLSGYCFAILGFLLLFFFPNRPVALVANVLFGGFYGIVYTYMLTHIPAIIPVERIDDSMGLITATYGIASFLLPYFVSALMSIFNIESITTIFGIGSLFGVLAVITQCIAAAGTKKREGVEENAA